MDKHETLGTDVLPIRYTLLFETDMKKFVYRCHELIELRAKKSTRRITLNAAGLLIKKVTVASGKRSQRARVSFDKGRERVTFAFESAVKGNVNVEIDFEGKNTDDLSGFYRSKYTVGKQTRYILTSQFEAANARNAFPCFDEPSFKSRFNVSMIVDKGLDCISNMPVKSSRPAGKGRKLVTFEETPVMCVYPLYLGVGNYDYVEGRAGRIRVRMITTPGKKKYAKLPLEYAVKFISFYEKYFGIRYPLPKMDLIAIPDFAAGAMENWGAVTFRESDMLADEKSSVAIKQRIAEVIAHEFAHQWFGDLVTMEWWNDLWLNESFATFMSYKAMDRVYPEWEMRTQYLEDTIATAFAADQLLSTHPIRVNVRKPGEIDEIFDEISYEKGGSVLNMIEDYVGEEIFRKGLNRYLKTHSYSNATNDDLWDAIDDAARRAGRRIRAHEVASQWISKTGYPIVKLTRNGNRVRLAQERFILLDQKVKQSPWPIPITYLVEGESEPRRVLMNERELELEIGNARWVKLNFQQNGLYRASYPPEMLEELGNAIKAKELSGKDAWGVENDLFVLARSGRIRAERYLEFADRYCYGADYPLNSNVLSHLGWLFDMLYYKPQLEHVKRVMLRYSNEMVAKLGWERKKDERSIDTLLRSDALYAAGLAGDRATIDRAMGMFSEFISKGVDIDQNIRGFVYSTVAWNSGRQEYEIFKKRYMKEERPDEKMRLLRMIGSFRDLSLARSALEFAMSKDVRSQNTIFIPYAVAGNPVGREAIWPWVTGNWQQLRKKFGRGTHMLDRFVSITGYASDRKSRSLVNAFFTKKANARQDIMLTVKKTVERIEVNTRFSEANP